MGRGAWVEARRLLPGATEGDDVDDRRIDAIVRRDVDVYAVRLVMRRYLGLDRYVVGVDQDDLVLPRVLGSEVAEPAA